MNRKKLFVLALSAIVAAGTLSACGSSSPTKTASSVVTPSTLPTTASTTSSGVTLPVASNPILNNSTAPGLIISYSAVENNVAPITHNALSDQLEITLKNTSSTTMTGIEIYYEMTDIVTKAKEGYYQKLNGVVIAPNQESTVFFDRKNQAGHFPENQFSLYRSSPNEVDFKIWASAPGVKIAQATAVKSKGTGEKPGA